MRVLKERKKEKREMKWQALFKKNYIDGIPSNIL